jgi:hypothetical protein
MYIDLFEDQYEILKPYTEIYTVDLSVYCIDKNNKVYIIIDTFINDEETLFLRVHKVNKNGKFNHSKILDIEADKLKPLRLITPG